MTVPHPRVSPSPSPSPCAACCLECRCCHVLAARALPCSDVTCSAVACSLPPGPCPTLPGPWAVQSEALSPLPPLLASGRWEPALLSPPLTHSALLPFSSFFFFPIKKNCGKVYIGNVFPLNRFYTPSRRWAHGGGRGSDPPSRTEPPREPFGWTRVSTSPGHILTPRRGCP